MKKAIITIDETHPSSKPFIDFIATLDEINILEIDGEKYESIENKNLDAQKIRIIKLLLEVTDLKILEEVEAIMNKA